MPKFQVEMSDGRKFQVDADTQPTEQEVLAHMNGTAMPASATGTADAFNKAAGLNSNEPETWATGAGRSLEDTALKTAKGIGEGALSAINPVNIATGIGNLATHPLDTLSSAYTGIKRFAGDALSGDLDPESGGQAIGGLATGLIGGRVLPPVVRGLKRIAPAAGPVADVALGAAKGALNNLPIVGPTVKGAIRGGRQAIEDRAIANIDNPGNVQRGLDAVTRARGTTATPTPEGFDRFMPNTPAMPTAAQDFAAPADTSLGVPQATYAQLEDGSWGLKGSNLKEGEKAFAMNRSGSGTLHTVGKVTTDANGAQTAAIGGLPPKIQALAKEMQGQSDLSNPWPTQAEMDAAPPPTAVARGPNSSNVRALLADQAAPAPDTPFFRDNPDATNVELARHYGQAPNTGEPLPAPTGRMRAPLDAKGQALIDQLWKQQPPIAVPPVTPPPSAFPSAIEQMLRASLDRGR